MGHSMSRKICLSLLVRPTSTSNRVIVELEKVKGGNLSG